MDSGLLHICDCGASLSICWLSKIELGFSNSATCCRCVTFRLRFNFPPPSLPPPPLPSTLQIGFITYIKGETPWKNIHGTIVHETDAVKQADLRRTLGSTVDYYITSVAAVTETGHLAHGDLSGSKVGPVSFAAGNVIVVAGSNKIVKDEHEAWRRMEEFAWPLESARVRIAYGLPASSITHYEVIRTPSPFNANRIQVLLINEALGY